MLTRWQKFTVHVSGVVLALVAWASLAAPIGPTEVQKLLAADGASLDHFGWAVAVSGDTAVIGAPYDGDIGSAYVFKWNGSAWAQQAKLIPTNPGYPAFGHSVAVDGTTVLIGAPYSGGGAAHVYILVGTSWVLQQQLQPADVQANDEFGYSVAIDGDTAVVSARLADVGDVGNAGAAYVFTRSGDTWSQQAKLTVSGAQGNDTFGHAVAVHGDTAVIGVPRDDDNSGSVYVFTRIGSGWAQQAKLTTSDSLESGAIGVSVAVDGDTAIVGAEVAADGRGFAYVFTRVGSNWVEQAKLVASDGAANCLFGSSVAVVGDTAMIGAYADDAPVSNGGAAYLFTRSAGSWTQQAKLTASDAAELDFFGRSVALGNGQALIGANEDDDKGTQSGSVYVFSLAQPTDTIPPEVTAVTAADIVYPADPIVTATASDTDSNIQSAEYSLDDGAWTAMAATDGTFDEKSEDLTATIPGPLGVDDYEVCVRATDTEGNNSDGLACDTFAVTAAAMTITFDGEYLDLNGSPTLLKATVSGPDACKAGATVDFYDGTTKIGQATTINVSGNAQLSLALSYGVYEIKALVLDRDLDEDGTAECTGNTDSGSTVVADPNAASTGGGWYKIPVFYGVAPPRVNFGYVANVKYNKKTGALITTGNLMWMNQDNFKLKGTINQSGKFVCPTSDHVQCAVFAGTGVLYEHNDSYNPAIDPASEEWTGNSPLEVSFVATVYDGGSSTVCQKKRCTVTERPDAIMMQINGASVPAAPYEIITLQGGNITVKK